MNPTPTGSHQRLRFEKMNVTPPQNCVLHATCIGYDFDSGKIVAVFDVQEMTHAPFLFTPQADGSYQDQAGRSWKLIN